MRNRFMCLLLALVLALPLLLASCSKAVETEDKPAAVYTLCCITGESTTPESITQVEYELNRTLFYRIGSIVKLVFATADEYQEMIEAKQVEVKDYIDGTNESGKNESKEKQVLVNTAKLSDSAKAAGYTAMSGDAILDDLANGIEIELECPRIDLFLATSYQEYLKLVEDEKVAALDTILTHEAKAIRSNVHSSFFNAAKVNGKTYGVPCNTIIGEYTYLVFNKNVLEASGAAQETMYSMEDLSDYLALIKKQNPDIIPLANTVTPYALSFMFEDGFATYVNNNGYVRSTYTDDTVNKYFTMLSRYSALGYFQNADGKKGDEADFAVKFMTGTKEEMELIAEENNYTYNQYTVPIATSENSIDCIYCVSSLCPESWRTDAMRILSALYTDVNLQNTFLYGVENTHYTVEGKQVVRLNKTYMMNYGHTGNCFIAYTDKDAGDSLTKWDDARKQNIDARESKTIGFTFDPTSYKFVTGLDEKGKEIETIVTEPDYQGILWEIIQPYYAQLMNGTAIDFNYEEEWTKADEAARQEIYDSLLETYTLRLNRTYTSGIQTEVEAQYGEAYKEAALDYAKNMLLEDIDTTSRKRRLRAQLVEENPDMSDEEIDALHAKLLKDKDGLWPYREIVRKESQWQTTIDGQYEDLIEERVNERTEAVLNGADYRRDLAAIPTSEKFLEEYEHAVEAEVEDTVNSALDAMLSEKITEFCTENIINQCNAALEEAIDTFATEYAAATEAALRHGIFVQLKTLYTTESDEQILARVDEWRAFLADHINDIKSKDTSLENALKRQLKKDFPDMDDETLNTTLTALEDTFENVYLNLYTAAYNEKKQALYQIGYLSREALTSFGGTTAEDDKKEETDKDPEGDEDTPTAGQYESYYEFVILAKFQESYYKQFGSPF